MKSASNNYRELILKGVRFCAYLGKGVPLSIWERYPVRGGRKLAKIMRLLSRFGLDRMITKSTQDPNAEFSALVGSSKGVAYSWPAASRSTGRYYAYVYDKSTRQIVSYVKFATSEGDRDSLHREVAALKRLSGVTLPFSIAGVTQEGHAGGADFAAFELLPANKDVIDWTADSWQHDIKPLCDAFAAGTLQELDARQALSLPWVMSFKGVCSPSAWTRFSKSVEQGMKVCLTHGDMACHNILKSNGRWWIFDWENLTDVGPMITDELTVEMCTRVFEQGVPFDKALEQYLTVRHGGKLKEALIQAMAFIVYSKNSLWREYLQVLEEVK